MELQLWLNQEVTRHVASETLPSVANGAESEPGVVLLLPSQEGVSGSLVETCRDKEPSLMLLQVEGHLLARGSSERQLLQRNTQTESEDTSADLQQMVPQVKISCSPCRVDSQPASRTKVTEQSGDGGDEHKHVEATTVRTENHRLGSLTWWNSS